MTSTLARNNMAFPPKIQEDALVACNRHCCLCHKFCGLKIELHHIVHKSEGGKDIADNCIPLCFDCHGDMRSYDHKHPKGHKYTANELIRHRDNWYAKVQGAPSPTYDQAAVDLDKNVYLAIVKLLPYPGTMSLIEHHNFCGPFRASLFSDLDRFIAANDNPAMEFIDADLEGQRATLVDELSHFNYYLATHTWRLGESMQSVPADWEDTQPARLDSVVNDLNAMGSKVAERYRTLVREARRRLRVDIDPIAG
ncbi:MAG: HNH endonuclease [Sideroxyarcus sp.]|nr:HNH endonuclease [Sideroxyarcus sp.]